MKSGLIGTALIEDLVQTVALSHRVADRDRVGLLLLAAPESGKTTIACAATADHVKPIAVITGRSVLVELERSPQIEFLLFNDLASVRALSKPTVAHLIGILNQVAQGERGSASYAGRDTYQITRALGVIGCLPFKVFVDQRARWQDMGFISRMIPFAYHYDAELVAQIKNGIDRPRPMKPQPAPMPAPPPKAIHVHMSSAASRTVRALADARAVQLRQLGIRLLKHYHTLVRAHAIKHKRTQVTKADLDFLRAIDRYVSITECHPL